MTLLWIVLSTLFIGVVSLVGIIFVMLRLDVQKLAFYLVSLASGTMLGSAFIHIIPEALEEDPKWTLLRTAGGVFIFFVLEKFLVWRHCHLHQHLESHTRRTTAKIVIVGDLIHNFIDGTLVATSYLASREVGIAVTTAIVFHEIPQELGDFGILIHGGYPVRKALMFNALTAVSSIVGGILTYFFIGAVPLLQPWLLPITAGGFLYIALADLIPQLHEQTSARAAFAQISLLMVGFVLILLLKHA